jgi:hypothetical protein
MALARRDLRALTIGTVAIGIGLIVRHAAIPYVTHILDVRDRVASERELLARDLGLLGSQIQVENYRDGLERSSGHVTNRLFGGATDELALADIQRTVQQLAIDAEVPILQVRPDGTPEYTQNLTRWRVIAEGESDIEAVLEYLRRLEDSNRLMRVARLMIGQRDMLLDEGAVLEGRLRFSVAVDGYFISSEPRLAPQRRQAGSDAPKDGYIPSGYVPRGQ